MKERVRDRCGKRLEDAILANLTTALNFAIAHHIVATSGMHLGSPLVPPAMDHDVRLRYWFGQLQKARLASPAANDSVKFLMSKIPGASRTEVTEFLALPEKQRSARMTNAEFSKFIRNLPLARLREHLRDMQETSPNTTSIISINGVLEGEATCPVTGWDLMLKVLSTDSKVNEKVRARAQPLVMHYDNRHEGIKLQEEAFRFMEGEEPQNVQMLEMNVKVDGASIGGSAQFISAGDGGDGGDADAPETPPPTQYETEFDKHLTTLLNSLDGASN